MHIVLVEPEIPPNTGNIARSCVMTATTLHLIEPLGFSLDEKHLRRSGLDYWKYLNLEVHSDFNAFKSGNPAVRLIAFSTQGKGYYHSMTLFSVVKQRDYDRKYWRRLITSCASRWSIRYRVH